MPPSGHIVLHNGSDHSMYNLNEIYKNVALTVLCCVVPYSPSVVLPHLLKKTPEITQYSSLNSVVVKQATLLLSCLFLL